MILELAMRLNATKEPEKYKELIEGLLKDNWIEFSYSEANRFAVFRSGKLP